MLGADTARAMKDVRDGLNERAIMQKYYLTPVHLRLLFHEMAVALIEDFQRGLNNHALLQKYELTDQDFAAFFQRLSEWGYSGGPISDAREAYIARNKGGNLRAEDPGEDPVPVHPEGGAAKPASVATDNPVALFVGDFTTGKSSLINALIRRPVMPTAIEQTTKIPTLLLRGPSTWEASYFAVGSNGNEMASLNRNQFVSLVCGSDLASNYRLLAAVGPSVPFNSLMLVDTEGIASVDNPSLQVTEAWNSPEILLVVVINIEFWQSRYTMELIKELSALSCSLIVVANKADRLNASEILNARQKAPALMERRGMKPLPPFVILSARLEQERGKRIDGYRDERRKAVIELCDAGFDRLRVLMHEFEAARQFEKRRPLSYETVRRLIQSFSITNEFCKGYQ